MTVACIRCLHFNLKGSPLGKLGFGLCPHKSRGAGHTFSATFPRECAKFEPAAAETVDIRTTLLRKEGAIQ